MKAWLQFLAVLVMVVVAGTAPRPAEAATSVGTSGIRSTERIINDIIRGTPGVSTATTTGTGATVTTTGTARVPAGGVSIPVPTTASASVSAARVAGIAARAIRWGSWAGIAGVVLPWAAEKSGIVTCPPPDFFCKKEDDEETAPTGAYWEVSNTANRKFTGSTGQAACDAMFAVAAGSDKTAYGPLQFRYSSGSTVSGRCYGSTNNRSYGNIASLKGATGTPECPEGFNLVGTKCVKPGGIKPVTEPVLGDAIEQGISGNPDRIKRTYDAVRNAGFPVFQPTDPVTVTVPPSVMGRPTTTTTTQAKPDGSVDTVQTTTQTEVKPQVNGNTISNTTISYPTTTTTTTTTTNNVTNITYNTTTITNSYSTPETSPDTGPDGPPKPETPLPESPEDQEKVEIPTDYNREVTQKSILETLKEFVAPITEALPTGEAETGSIQAANDQAMQGVTDISEGSLGLTSWFPSIPTAQCVNPQVTTPITGDMVTVPICDAVNVFSQIVSGVLCFFCIVGCVAQVRAAQQA